MIRKIMPSVLVLLSVLIDTAVLPFIPALSGAYTPLISLCTLVALALVSGPTLGSLHGMLTGLLLECSVMSHYGVRTVMFTLFGLLIGFAGRQSKWRLVSSLFGALFSFVIYEASMFFLQYLDSGLIDVGQIWAGLVRVAINTFITQVLFLLYWSIVQPDLDGYWRR